MLTNPLTKEERRRLVEKYRDGQPCASWIGGSMYLAAPLADELREVIRRYEATLQLWEEDHEASH